jgi:4-hydroxythreonine-4-phosphate dehydrogenase
VDLTHAPAIAAALGRLVPPLFETLGGLVATGGDIARAVLSSLGASGIHLVGEVEPGVPLGLADTPRPLPLVTKAGAFGNPSTLKRCRAALKGRSS